jgi:predicted phosphodiesterase
MPSTSAGTDGRLVHSAWPQYLRDSKEAIPVRPITWLHISDFHLRDRDSWSQDVVLRAMCDSISRQRAEGKHADFILATGDVAYAGKAEDYRLAPGFLDAVNAAAGVPKARMYCIPGNHDIERDREKMCFSGCRHELQSPSHVDALLAGGDDLATLLRREEHYRAFQDSYFAKQERTRTADGLGYVSGITIEDVRFAIAGLDSAWLAEGGLADQGRLLIGERQVINALDLVGALDPHIVIAMAHHPLHLLREFERLPIQNRVERACHFFHCGHLHEPEARNVVYAGTGCLTLAAGASFETRGSRNTYSLVTLDLLAAQRTVETVQYNPASGAFEFSSTIEYPIEITPTGRCGVSELAEAMRAHLPSLAPLAHYFSALLLGAKTEILIPSSTSYTFGTLAVLQTQPDSDLKRRTAAFMAFRNVFRVFYGRRPLPELFSRYGDAVRHYGSLLDGLCSTQPQLKARLADRERDALMLAGAESSGSFSHTVSLFEQLAADQAWDLLREQAERHVSSHDRSIAIPARRMLALSLAQSAEANDRAKAIEIYRSLIGDNAAEPRDVGNLVTLLLATGRFDEAKAAVLDGIERFPADAKEYLGSVGQRIVEATGDRALRETLAVTKATKRQA